MQQQREWPQGLLIQCGAAPNPRFSICEGGTCVCEPHEVVCGGPEFPACTDLENSEHCGACGNACPDDYMCEDGRCAPRPCFPHWECDGRCVNPANDNQHCGYCGNTCEVGWNCENWQCVSLCTAPHRQCVIGEDGGCDNVLNDNRHCGECGNACGVGANCVNGTCV